MIYTIVKNHEPSGFASWTPHWEPLGLDDDDNNNNIINIHPIR